MTGTVQLASLAAETGVLVQAAANLPVELNDPNSVWYVQSGAVDVFFVERRNGRDAAAPQHLLHVKPGRLLLGAAPGVGDNEFFLVAKGHQDTVLRRLDSRVVDTLDSEEWAGQVDLWVSGIASGLSQRIEARPRPDVLIEPGTTTEAVQGVLSSRRGVVWLSSPESGKGLYASIVHPEEIETSGGDVSVALTPESWIDVLQPCRIAGRSSVELAGEGVLAACAGQFHALVFAAIRGYRQLSLVDDANLQRERVAHRRTDADRATYDLLNLLNETARTDSRSEWLAALRVIGRHEGISFGAVEDLEELNEGFDLRNVIDAADVRCRRLRLRAEDRWWIGDSGALLGFRSNSGQPVALLPDLFGRYRELGPSCARGRRVTAARAADFEPDAFMFYTPLRHASSGLEELGRLARMRVSGDLVRFFVTGFLGGLALLFPAALIGLITERIIPESDHGLLYPAIAALVTVALLGAALHILQGTALLRLEGRITSRIEAALWDRILKAPSSFLRRNPVGDIAARGMALRALRDSIAGPVADSLVSIVFLLPAFALMVAHDLLLGGASLLLGTLSLAVIVRLAWLQIPWHRRILRASRGMSSLLFQLVNGVAKIRAGCAESSAFAKWAREYREQKRAEMGLGVLNEHLVAFSTAIPLFSSALLLAITDPRTVPVSDFLLIFAALTIFQAAVVRLGASFTSVAAIVPACELVSPILSEEPEGVADGEPVEELKGEIRFDRISFRYDPDGPPILDNVSIYAARGEFVAITGVSGSGKSTLIRIALGIETPSSGAVYYDGRDMARLNLKQLRRRIGVVPQDTALLPETIRDNITSIAESDDTDAVWRAAKLAAVDEDIARMPMGLSTIVGLSRPNLSGGESQRIMIAAALIDDPSIVMMDEATNWLDNKSQSTVMNSIENVSTTRLVIAHRLSTLQQADRIYVLQGGKVAQQGTYSDLVEADGPFRDMVRRQSL